MKHLLLYSLLAAMLTVSWAAEKKPKQYKKQNRDRITQLAKGETEKAVAYFEDYLEKEDPKDLESMFGLAIGYAQMGDMAKSKKMIEMSLKAGLPIERYYAGPRELTRLLPGLNFDEPRLLHGPMLGAVTDTEARFWVRTSKPMPVVISVNPAAKGSSLSYQLKGKTSAEHDFTAILQTTELKPATEYTYEVVIDGKIVGKSKTFKTMPATARPAAFKVVFGGGAGYTPIYEHMWDTVNKDNPDALFLLGDNVYIDTPFTRATQQYCYYRRQSRDEFRRLVSEVPVFAIWDDHDFYNNDGTGMHKFDPAWKKPVWETFKNNWNNPSYGGGHENPGCWFKHSIADVDFFFIDGRYYRDREEGTMLGAFQKKWLLEGLKNSRATFKVLCSNVPITPNVKPGSKDTWDGYAAERTELFNFINRERIDGFFVIAADRHRSDAWKNERPRAYPIYEFQSSKLTNIHTHPIIKGSLFGYNKTCSFGRLTFDTTKPDPKVTYTVVTINGKEMHELTLKKSQLTHP